MEGITGNGLLGIGGSLLGAGISAISQNSANKKNEALQREAWARDDTRYSRMVKDLKASGLNPLLATGANPGQSQPVRVESVGKEAGGHVAGAAQNAISGYAAQTQRMMAQADAALKEQQAQHTKQMFEILKQYGPRSEEARIGLQEQQTTESGKRVEFMESQRLLNNALATLPAVQADNIRQLIDESKARITDLASQQTHRTFQNVNLAGQTAKMVADVVQRALEFTEHKRMNQFQENQITAATYNLQQRSKLTEAQTQALLDTIATAVIDNRTVNPTYARPEKKAEAKSKFHRAIDGILGKPSPEDFTDAILDGIFNYE